MENLFFLSNSWKIHFLQILQKYILYSLILKVFNSFLLEKTSTELNNFLSGTSQITSSLLLQKTIEYWGGVPLIELVNMIK